MAKSLRLRLSSLFALCLFMFANAAQNNSKQARDEDREFTSWQPNPDRRGTLEIIDSCIFTIFACTWTIQHPNLPAVGEPKVKEWSRKWGWMLLNVLLPEFFLAEAIVEFLWAHRSLRILEANDMYTSERGWKTWLRRIRAWAYGESKRGTDPDSQEWTLQHCYYANMGGFHIHRSRDSQNFLMTIDSCVKYDKESDGSFKKIYGRQPPLPRSAIEDKDKGSSFAKTISLLQILWLLVSLVIRKAQDIATSQLEILTLAFAGCAFIIYCFRWAKPKDIKISTAIQFPDEKQDEEQDQKKLVDLIHFTQPKTFRQTMMIQSTSSADEADFERGPNNVQNGILKRFKDDTIGHEPEQLPVLLLLVVVMIPIGALHLFAWNFRFPTPPERILWRIATLVSMCIPIALLLIIWLVPIIVSSLITTSEQKHRRQLFITACLEAMEDLEDSGEPYKQLKNKEPKYYSQIFDKNDTKYIANLRALFVLDKRTFTYSGSKDQEFLEIFDALIKHLDEDPAPEDIKHPSGILENILEVLLLKNKNEGPITTDNFPNAKQWKRAKLQHRLLKYISPLVAAIYMIARICIIAVAFSSLRAMSDSVYQTTFAKYFPSLD